MVPCRQGWLSHGIKRVKRASSTGDNHTNGLPLTDDILLHIFAVFLSMSDLIRCAATCSQCRRLVSRNASYICRSMPRLNSFVYSLAIGFFYQKKDKEDGLCEAPIVVRLFMRFRQASMAWLFSEERFRSARLVACRKGRLILDLRRASLAAVLSLVVYNPMTGEVFLPPLFGDKLWNGWGSAEDVVSINLRPFLPYGMTLVQLHGVCEQSGLIFFAACSNWLGNITWRMYMLDLQKKVVQLLDVDNHCRGPENCKRFFPYEMDQAAYLMLLGGGDFTQADDRHVSLV
uniref:F-box domain-containing protein n=1 Tax=Leersia perrieri TaxID=77586 RepID=A0A0D9XIQ1_9ORYZ